MSSGPLALSIIGLAVAQGDAAEPPRPESPAGGVEAAAPDQGTVYTFYGLLTLEADPDVADREKVRQWQAFIERAEKQLEYAQRAVERWESAARRRAIEAALAVESDPSTSRPERAQAWREAARAQVDPDERRKAEKRADYWRVEHARALVVAAKRVEDAGRPKVERIDAWREVVRWRANGEAVRAARERIRALRDQLFTEARSIQAAQGIDAATKVEAWEDVLAGQPTPAQRAEAEARLAALRSED